MQDALWKMPATAQAEAVRRADVSAVELIDSHLERIAEVNPRMNAVTQLLAERARAAAGQTDRRRAAGEALGPLAGVPFTVKESTAVEGVPTTFGTERFRNLVASADAPPVGGGGGGRGGGPRPPRNRPEPPNAEAEAAQT
ncbi:amidase family protein, partial [Streptomyces sp. NPDC059153]|uniref:amidase family protein n=1 Tax=Streptomyces sp. NPDC059153 TaxID=3346743 RepID=UPI0036C4D08F